MTALQQTCNDMLQAQYQQQRLCGFERSMHRNNQTHILQFRVLREAMAVQANEIQRCQSLLVNSTAANDEPVPGEAA